VAVDRSCVVGVHAANRIGMMLGEGRVLNVAPWPMAYIEERGVHAPRRPHFRGKGVQRLHPENMRKKLSLGEGCGAYKSMQMKREQSGACMM